MTRPQRIRLFLDSNVLTGSMVSPWGVDHAVLSLCAAGIGRLVLAELVNEEVEENLRLHADRLGPERAVQLFEDYRQMISLIAPERVPYPDAKLLRAHRHPIRHAAEVPVLLSVLASQPDWLLTHSPEPFKAMVPKGTGLRISTPAGFFRTFAAVLR